MKDFLTGLRLTFSSFRFIRENKLNYIYVWILVIELILVAAALLGATNLSDYLAALVANIPATEGVLGWLVDALQFVAEPLSWLVAFIVGVYVSGYLTLVFLSPVLSHFVEQAAVKLSNQHAQDGLKGLLWGIARGITFSTRNMLIQTGLTILLLLLSLIPVVGIFATITIFFVDAFYYALSMADYAFETYGKTAKQSSQYAHNNRALMIGMGVPYALSLMIPVVGVFVAVLVAPACAIAAVRRLAEEKNSER